jgi:hypothetical protein
MIIIDRILVGGVRFVLDKVARVAEEELDDEGRVKEALVEAQMQLDLGEITLDEYDARESELIDELARIRKRTRRRR